jgi:hypothetical protein
VAATKRKMKLDSYRHQRRIQIHARSHRRTVAEHTMCIYRKPDLPEIKEERVL